ncbi:MAG: hypothetical protein EOO56_05485 [Hymenobacter sp.]|nr:MAG: hypothetical protein EOO56_05485 [Hymenobacter sp.]
MNQPRKKGAWPASARAAHSRATSAVGFAAGQVRQQLHQPPLAQPLAPAYSAQEQRYRQLLRAGRAVARPEATRQDGAIAYQAQALQRAEVQYRAQVAHRLSLERSFAAQLAHDRTYLSQGGTEAAHQQGRALAVQHKLEQNTRDMVQGQPEAAGIASGVVVGMAVASQVVAPELLAARLASTARALGFARQAVALETMGAGLAYKAGQMTWAGAGEAANVFGKRALLDAGLQYTGALVGNASKEYGETGDSQVAQLVLQSTSGINVTSVVMAGLPGDDLTHSLRNALVANAFELNRDPVKGWVYKHPNLSWGSALNYGQKVGLSVGTDYVAGRFGGLLQKARMRDGYSSTGPLLDPHTYALWRQRLWLLHRTEFAGVYGLKITGA